ncbi:MAG: DNA-binding protein [Oscillospiraceae bacterium]|jgi:predicted DNA-binding protein YlxM (UPF0122 family)|nr:DNA-binding protein [Oscillospiraceae bacterium]
MALLFDYYGDLLTDKQREYFDLYYRDDLSLSEIAENEGVSRQAVRDMLVRAEGILEDTERRTGFIARHDRLLAQIRQAEDYVADMARLASSLGSPELPELCEKTYDLLQEMKL